MKYIIDIPDKYLKGGFLVSVRTWDREFDGCNLSSELYIEPVRKAIEKEVQ